MKRITEQDIWDLMDDNCTSIQANYIHQQLQLEEHKELLEMYHTLQVLNSDLQTMEAVQPPANFNASVMAKLQPTHQAQTTTSTSNETMAFWAPISKWFLLAFALLIVLVFLLQQTTLSSSETIGTLGLFIIEGLGKLANLAQHPVFFSSLAFIYVLGLLTLLDGYLKKRFRYKRTVN